MLLLISPVLFLWSNDTIWRSWSSKTKRKLYNFIRATQWTYIKSKENSKFFDIAIFVAVCIKGVIIGFAADTGSRGSLPGHRSHLGKFSPICVDHSHGIVETAQISAKGLVGTRTVCRCVFSALAVFTSLYDKYVDARVLRSRRGGQL